jgi:hypothetical protein
MSEQLPPKFATMKMRPSKGLDEEVKRTYEAKKIKLHREIMISNIT